MEDYDFMLECHPDMANVVVDTLSEKPHGITNRKIKSQAHLQQR